jgi:hypothetical protein
MLSELMEGDVI